MQIPYHNPSTDAITPAARAVINCGGRSWRSFQRARDSAVQFFDANPDRRHVLLSTDAWEYVTLCDGSERAALEAYSAERVTMACNYIPNSRMIVRRLYPDNTPIAWRLEGEWIADLLFRISGNPLARERWGTAEDAFWIGSQTWGRQ